MYQWHVLMVYLYTITLLCRYRTAVSLLVHRVGMVCSEFIITFFFCVRIVVTCRWLGAATLVRATKPVWHREGTTVIASDRSLVVVASELTTVYILLYYRIIITISHASLQTRSENYPHSRENDYLIMGSTRYIIIYGVTTYVLNNY